MKKSENKSEKLKIERNYGIEKIGIQSAKTLNFAKKIKVFSLFVFKPDLESNIAAIVIFFFPM